MIYDFHNNIILKVFPKTSHTNSYFGPGVKSACAKLGAQELQDFNSNLTTRIGHNNVQSASVKETMPQANQQNALLHKLKDDDLS